MVEGTSATLVAVRRMAESRDEEGRTALVSVNGGDSIMSRSLQRLLRGRAKNVEDEVEDWVDERFKGAGWIDHPPDQWFVF